MRLAVHPSVTEQKIDAGSQLLINSSQVVVGVSEPMNMGEAVYVSERLDSERVLVTTSSGSSKVAATGARFATRKSGAAAA